MPHEVLLDGSSRQRQPNCYTPLRNAMDTLAPRQPKHTPKLLLLFNRTDTSASSSPMNGESVSQLATDLRQYGYETFVCNVDDDVDRVGDAVVVHRPTLVLNLVDHMFDDNTQHAGLASMLELFGYVYTGSDPLTLAICQDRVRTKLVLQNAGIPVPAFGVIRDINAIPSLETGHSMIVTQAFDDIYDDHESRVVLDTAESLNEHARELSTQFDLPFLVEEYLPGRRIQCILIGNQVLEILPLTESVYDEDDDSTSTEVAQLPLDAVDEMRLLARRAFKATGCRDVAQVDFVYFENKIYVIDVRPVVEFFEGPFPVAAEASGYGIAAAVSSIVRMAHKRLPAAELATHPLPPLNASSDAPAGQVQYIDEDVTLKYGSEIKSDEQHEEEESL